MNSEEVRRETFGFLHFNQKMDKSEGFAPPLFTFHSSLFTSNLGLSQSDKPKFESRLNSYTQIFPLILPSPSAHTIHRATSQAPHRKPAVLVSARCQTLLIRSQPRVVFLIGRRGCGSPPRGSERSKTTEWEKRKGRRLLWSIRRCSPSSSVTERTATFRR